MHFFMAKLTSILLRNSDLPHRLTLSLKCQIENDSELARKAATNLPISVVYDLLTTIN